ncbi:MAG: polysaccharide pyruvyl transferase family protein [Thermodesulfobacteriota bacterium]
MKQRTSYSLFPDRISQDVPTLIEKEQTTQEKHIGHVAMYSDGNAGDTLLPRTVRDTIDRESSNDWKGIHAHRVVNRSLLREINALDGLLIGGGGLFLRDTNPNNLSGWQWSCSIKALEQIKVPIALFAVGYNRFRGQKDFKPIFRRHLELLAQKCLYLGLRNTGSIEAVKSYLPDSLHHKVRFQPCPTTLCKHLYPEICSAKPERPTIALNCAFDRIDLRLGGKKNIILTQLAEAAKELSKHATILYYSHAKGDEQMLSYLDKAKVPYELRKLYYIPPRDVVTAYSKISLAIGMRGHAQMIPFGCGTPIISLISHDKVRWFLDDIARSDWGIEMTSPDFKDLLVATSTRALSAEIGLASEIDEIQQSLLETTRKNVLDFTQSMNG